MIAHFSRLLLYCLRARASSPAERMGSTAMEKIRTASGHTAPQHQRTTAPLQLFQSFSCRTALARSFFFFVL